MTTEPFKVALVALLLSTVPVAALACDTDNGARQQLVSLLSDGTELVRWNASSDQIEVVALPNGFRLGVRIEDADAKKYEQLHRLWKFVPEMVHITLYDMSGAKPRELTHTWGGANSLQGYGPNGGADRIIEAGDAGILLFLQRPVCAQMRAGSWRLRT